MFRNATIVATGEYHHIYNRGNDKQVIFHDKRDWTRFLFLILHLQSDTVFENIGRYVNYFVKHRMFNTHEDIPDILRTRSVELTGFTLMPNHFHLVITGVKDRGISEYMRRIQDAYTKYFNVKYKRTGHLFQGPYQAVHIKENRQLLHLSAYIHKNPRELPAWKNKEHLYPWSSYQDYIQNRWGELLHTDIILEQFDNHEDYVSFVKSSSAKESLPATYIIDQNC